MHALDTFTCPACQSREPFLIVVSASVHYDRAGPRHPPAWEFHAGSYCQCVNCGKIGIVKQFRSGKEG